MSNTQSAGHRDWQWERKPRRWNLVREKRWREDSVLASILLEEHQVYLIPDPLSFEDASALTRIVLAKLTELEASHE